MQVSRGTASLTSTGMETRACPSPVPWPARRRSLSRPWTLTQQGNHTCCHCCSEGWRRLWPGERQLQHREEGQAGLGLPIPTWTRGQASP